MIQTPKVLLKSQWWLKIQLSEKHQKKNKSQVINKQKWYNYARANLELLHQKLKVPTVFLNAIFMHIQPHTGNKHGLSWEPLGTALQRPRAHKPEHTQKQVQYCHGVNCVSVLPDTSLSLQKSPVIPSWAGSGQPVGQQPFGGTLGHLQLQTAFCSTEASGVGSCSLYIQDQPRINPKPNQPLNSLHFWLEFDLDTVLLTA